MAKVNSVIKETITINAPSKKVYELLSNYEKSASHVPDLRKIEKLAEDTYRWEFEPVGVKGINIQVKYSVKFSTIPEKEVSWETIPGSGNAEVKGKFEINDKGGSTELTLSMDVTIDAPIPKLMSKMAKPLLDKEVKDLVKGYLENIKKSLEE